MNKRCKLKGYLCAYRNEVDRFRELSDAEYRLLKTYLAIVDWDIHHDDYALTTANNKQMKDWYLPYWSEQKIGRTKKFLEARGLIEVERPNKKVEFVRIPNFSRYQKPSKKNEEMESQLEELEAMVPNSTLKIPESSSSGMTTVNEVISERYFRSPDS